MIEPNWKFAKNGTKYWTWLVAQDDPNMTYQVTRLSFFKTANKVTLRAKVASHKYVSSRVKETKTREMNIMSFYLRKGKTLEVYRRKNIGFPHILSEKKMKFNNISNELQSHIGQIASLVKYSGKINKMFHTHKVTDYALQIWFCRYLEAALKDLMKDNGIEYNVPDEDYDPHLRFAASIIEYRYPIIKTLRQDWIKYHRSQIVPGIIDKATSVNRETGLGNPEVKKIIPSYRFHLGHIRPIVLKELAKCKDIKDVVRRFTGNEGKLSTKSVFQCFYATMHDFYSEDQYRSNNLSGKVRAHEVREKYSGNVYMTITGGIDVNLLLMALSLKGILTTDHMNNVLGNYLLSKQSAGFRGSSSFSSGIYSLLVDAAKDNLYDPRDVAYKYAFENDRSCIVAWRKSLKKFRKDDKIVMTRVREFIKLLGNSKKIADLVNDDSLSFFNDTFKQWWVANGKIAMPDKIKSLRELHDYIAKEYRKLTSKDFDLGLMEVDWVKPLHGLEFSDIRTKRHYMIQIPQSNFDIVEWGQQMNNCIGGYGTRVRDGNGKQVLLAVWVAGKMKYNLEIYDKQVKQFYGKGNSTADRDDKEVFMASFKFLKDYDGMFRYEIQAVQEDIARALQLPPGDLLANPEYGIAAQRREEDHYLDAMRYAMAQPQQVVVPPPPGIEGEPEVVNIELPQVEPVRYQLYRARAGGDDNGVRVNWDLWEQEQAEEG